jgi:hypothetical protein
MKPWASAVSAKSNLTQQLKRDIELGFSCVGAMHVIATTPDTGSFGGAMHAEQFFPPAALGMPTVAKEYEAYHWT